MTTALTTTEKKTLAQCEKTIEKHLSAFQQVGSALLTIRDEKLFKGEYTTFKAYCDARWGFSDSRARQLIAAAKTAESVTTVTVSNERQARKLASALKSLPPEQRENCQKDYADECREAGEPQTAEGLQEAVNLYQADNDPYVEPPDADSDALEPELAETPAPTREAADEAVATPRSPCEVFWEILEMHIDQFLKGLSKKDRAMATASLVARLEAKVEQIRSKT